MGEELRFENRDCVDYLKSLDDRMVDLMILDPPYFRAVKDDWDNQWFVMDEWINWCDQWIEQLGRVSKWSGSLWLFGYSYQLTKLLPLCEKHGFTFRQQIAIDKGMQAVAGRTSKKLKMFPTATEYAYYFHYEARNHIRDILQAERQKYSMNGNEVNSLLGKATTGGGTFACVASMKKPLEHRVYPTAEDWSKLSAKFDLPNYEDVVYYFDLPQGLTDVWSDINFYDRSEPKFHSTQKPLKLIERIVQCSSRENGLVLDPFMGSGSTAIACDKLNRRWIGCEGNADYYTKSLERINHHKKPKASLNAFISNPDRPTA